MWIRKFFSFGFTSILLAGLLATPVYAHGHHMQANSTPKICSLCTLEDCNETGYHIHDDQAYCGYDHTCGYCDGSCGLVEVCNKKGCEEEGYHMHDSQTYCGYDHEYGYCDGSCAAVKVCPLEDCTKIGLHTHDGHSYCGYDHEYGYCDGSCEKRNGYNSYEHNSNHYGKCHNRHHS